MTASADLAIVEAPRSLGELADAANREHEAAIRRAGEALLHAIRCGEALVAAKAQVQGGHWTKWVDENFAGSMETAWTYVRCARNKSELLDSGATTIEAATAALRGPVRPNGNWHPPEMRDEAKRLHAQGLGYTRIAAQLGVAHKTVRRWVNPDSYRRERAQTRAARDAFEKRQRLAVARKCKDPRGVAYETVERYCDTLSRAWAEADDPSIRAALSEALRHAHKARDATWHALGIAHGAGSAG